MQTFLPDMNVSKAIDMLDNKRLGKQRVEAIQIASCLLEKETRWKNHPAVLMWKGYEDYLVLLYLNTTIETFGKRGFKNYKCLEHYKRLKKLVNPKNIKRPPWYNENFVLSHQSNLLRKNKDYYSKYFNVRDDLPYIWYVKKVEG